MTLLSVGVFQNIRQLYFLEANRSVTYFTVFEFDFCEVDEWLVSADEWLNLWRVGFVFWQADDFQVDACLRVLFVGASKLITPFALQEDRKVRLLAATRK